jgi:DNA-binding NarL/FixJ family response regulator
MADEKIRIMIAEDQPLIRRALAAMLTAEADIEVVAQAADGSEAIRMARAWRPDVVLMDIKMPRVNGIEATRQICADAPKIQVVMLTTFDADALIFDAILAGAQGYLLKDAEEAEILATVRDVARGQSRLSPAVARRVLDDFRRTRAPTSATQIEGDPLTEREAEILKLIVAGLGNREISEKVGLAEGTVKNRVSSILSKLHARSRTELAVKALSRPRK